MTASSQDIVLTGAGLITALGTTRDQVWQAVRSGRCGMGPMSAMESPLPPGKDGGQAMDLPADFEPGLPREARYLRRAILDSLSDAGITSDTAYPAHRRALVIGTTLHGMRAGGDFLRSGDFAHLQRFLAGQTIELAARDLPIEGLSVTTCSACSSSLGSTALGVTLLQSGQCDLVVVGGYDTISEYVYGGFNSLRLVADGALRPFSRNRQGMKLAEGYGIVVLERAADANRRGAKVLAHLIGWGESADAHHLTQPHPFGVGAAKAIDKAIARAGIAPADIGLIAAHATGTPDNDASEYAALSNVFGANLCNVPVVGFKSHLGHTLGGAGAVELILSMMALLEQTIPPSANVTRDEIAFDDLRVAVDAPQSASIRATLNTSLGFGGANTSVVLSQSARAGAASDPDSTTTSHSNLREVFITGVGAVLPGMVGNDALIERLRSAASPAWENAATKFDDRELEGLLNARRVRRMSEYVKLQLAAATIACRDAAIADMPAFAESCAAILGTMHGSAGYSASYYGQIVREGIAAANPMLFAEGVPNGAAAQLSLMLGIKGACQTVIGMRTAGLDALNLAAARIATGAWDRAIVGAGEESFDIIEQAYRHCGLATKQRGSAPFSGEEGFVCGAGAVAIVLESRASIDQRQAQPRARITNWSAARSPRAVTPEALTNLFSRLGEADGLLSSACGTWIDRAESIAIRRSQRRGVISTIYGHVPELFSASPLLGIASVILNRRMPRLLGTWSDDDNLRGATGEERISSAVCIATDFTGCVAGTRIELLGD